MKQLISNVSKGKSIFFSKNFRCHRMLHIGIMQQLGGEECLIEWWEELNFSQNSVNWEGGVSYLKWVGKYFKRIKVTPRPPLSYLKESQCVKSVHIRSYSGPYSVRMRENEDQNNFEYEHFSRSEQLQNVALKFAVPE